MGSVSVVIPNWNGEKFISQCLRSVFSQTHPPLEVILVDNGSTDKSLQIVEEDFKKVITIENQANLGFSMAVNQGIERSSGQYILLLNNDIRLEPDFVSAMIEAISARADIGSVSGKLLRAEDGRGKIIDSTGHSVFKNRLARDRGEDEEDKGQYDLIEEVFGACAAASLYRREMLDDVQVDGEYFDQTFFAFLEDVDLNWRAQLRGWKCVYTPKAVGYHHRGGTAIRRTRLVEEHNYKNRYLMILKNDSPASVIRNLSHFLLTDFLKTAGLLFRCPSALLGGWAGAIKVMPAALRKRKMIQGNRKVTRAEIERWFEPFDYRSWIKKHLWG